METKNKTRCAICGDTGWVLESEPDALGYPFYRECPACNCGKLSERYIFDSKQNMKLPVRLDGRLMDFDWQIYGENISKTKLIVDSFLKDYEKWKEKAFGLYFYSATKGSGKSFLGCCLLNELTAKYGLRCRYASVSELISMQQADSKLPPGSHGQIQQLLEVEVLLLDDIGEKKSGNNWISDILFSVVDYRYCHMKVTLFTSNCMISELALDERCIDRIFSMSVQAPLPEFSVRAHQATEQKREFLKTVGVQI